MISRIGLERIASLRMDILKMARYVQYTYNKSSVAALDRKENQAREVLGSDRKLIGYLVELERTTINLMGILTPMGKDLRFLTMSMSIVRTLERIGSKCVFISQRSLELMKKPPIGYHEKLKRMFEGVSSMLRGALDNLVDPSLSEVQRLCEADSLIDRLFEEAQEELINNSQEAPSTVARALDLLRIFGTLEEIGDLTTELMGAAVYIDTGRYYYCIDDNFKLIDLEVF